MSKPKYSDIAELPKCTPINYEAGQGSVIDAQYNAMMAARANSACVQNVDENIFGKSRSKFDEAMAHRSCELAIQQIIWSFASLPEKYKHDCVDAFNALHFNEPRTAPRWKMEEVK
jgi:hypothetical protein